MARLFSIPASLLLRTFYWFPFWCPTETQEGNLDLLRTLCALFTLRQDTDLPSARSFLLVCTPPRMPETAWALCKESFLWVRQQWWKPCLHIDYFVPFNNLIDQTCVCFVCVKGFFAECHGGSEGDGQPLTPPFADSVLIISTPHLQYVCLPFYKSVWKVDESLVSPLKSLMVFCKWAREVRTTQRGVVQVEPEDITQETQS